MTMRMRIMGGGWIEYNTFSTAFVLSKDVKTDEEIRAVSVAHSESVGGCLFYRDAELASGKSINSTTL